MLAVRAWSDGPLDDVTGGGAGAPVFRDSGTVREVPPSVSTASGASPSSRAVCTRTPRPTMTPHKKITTATTVEAMKRKTSCLPFS